MTSTCLNFTTADDFCSLSALKVHARVACRKLYERYPRHTDLSKDGYEIEKISGNF